MAGEYSLVPMVGARDRQRCNVASVETGWAGAMNIAFFASGKQREKSVSRAFMAGVRASGDKCIINDMGETLHHEVSNNNIRQYTKTLKQDGVGVAVMVGVKSIEIYRACRAADIHTIMLDKGYQRHRNPIGRYWEYWRAAVDDHHPTDTLMDIDYPRDRMAGVKLSRWRTPTDQGHIILAGSSAKYHRFYNLPEPTQWAIHVVAELRKYTNREIIYRPKASWHDAVPIEGTSYSKRPDDGRIFAGKYNILEALAGAHALVTHGSNACFEAVTSGVPCIILGNGVAKPISSTDIADINNPRLASMQQRQKWLAALSYSQWTLEEFKSGEAWATIRPQIGEG